MIRLLTQLSTMVALTGVLAVTLALGAGRAAPRGEEIIFNSSTTWQAADVNIFVLDLSRNLVLPMFQSRADNLPGLPLIWSPDGQQLAYVRSSEDDQTYLMDMQDMRPRRLAVPLTETEFNAVWSPDGQRLAFVGAEGRTIDIYIAQADGSEARNLTQNGRGYKNLMWSPDSRWIAAESLRGSEDIYLIDSLNGLVINLTDDPDKDIRPAWSPDGRELAFLSSRANRGTAGTRFDLYTLALDCVEQLNCPQSARRLTVNHPADSMWLAKWASDNRRLLFGSTSAEGGSDILLVDNQTAEAQNVTGDADPDSSPEWSPDGRHFVFESRRGKNWTIYLMDSETLESTALTDGQHDNRSPIWSPDGNSILFTANPQRNWDLYRLNLTLPAVPQRLTRGWTIEYAPLWRPSG